MFDIYSKEGIIDVAEIWAGDDVDAVYLGNELIWPDKGSMDGGYVLQLPTWENNRAERAAMEHVRLAYLNFNELNVKVIQLWIEDSNNQTFWYINSPFEQSTIGQNLILQGNLLAIPADVRARFDAHVGSETYLRLNTLVNYCDFGSFRGAPSKELRVQTSVEDGGYSFAETMAGPALETMAFVGTLTLKDVSTALPGHNVTIVLEVKNIPSGGICKRFEFGVLVTTDNIGKTLTWEVDEDLSVRVDNEVIGEASVLEYEEGEFFTDNKDYATTFKLEVSASSCDVEATAIAGFKVDKSFLTNIIGKF